MKLSKNFKIAPQMCDCEGYLSLKNMVDLMMEVSYEQAYICEKDIDMKNYRWIVYSWDIKIDRPIKLNSEVEITTVAVDMDKFYASRNFSIKENGRVIILAKTLFLLVDIRRMRVIKIPENIKNAYGRDEKLVEFKKIPMKKNLDYTKDIAIRLADIDCNYHVNNAIYFDYIKEITRISDKDISYINVVYKNEIRNKDYVKGYHRRLDKEIDFAIKNESDDKVYTYGRVIANV